MGSRRGSLGSGAVAVLGVPGFAAGSVLLARLAVSRAAEHRWPGARMMAPDLVEAITVALLALGAAVAAWYAVTAALVLALRLGHATGATMARAERGLRRWGAPLLRRAVLTASAAGLGVALTLPAAGTTPAEPPADLGWGSPAHPGPPATQTAPGTSAPTPATQTGTSAPTPATRTGTSAAHLPGAVPPGAGETGPAGAGPTPDPYSVRPGDSLWAIAAAHLPAGATAGDVAVAWPRWYELNRDVVGPDPDLIHPGQLLLAPTEEAP